jgi:hypothetical protein
MSASPASAAKVIFPAPTGAVPVPDSLADLLKLTAAELQPLYEQASVPKLADLSGDLRGRMLAWAGLVGVVGGIIRAVGSWDRFPWRGKSFSHQADDSGAGINRVVVDTFRLFKFNTFVGPSRAGKFDAVQLDYDLPSNPFFIRAIKDEVRQLRPGLFLGQAYLDLKSAPRLVLYFALEKA